MLMMLVFYDRDGNVVGTLDHCVARDDDGEAIGLVDFLAHEEAGGKMRDIADMSQLDMPVPTGIAKKFLGRDPKPDEAIHLPPDHPFRLAHETVAGAATWPEWIGGYALSFQVALTPGKRIGKLIHRASGHVRDREQIEAAIASRIADARAQGRPADLRDLVGGPDRPLRLDEDGRTRPRAVSARKPLPVVAKARGHPL